MGLLGLGGSKSTSSSSSSSYGYDRSDSGSVSAGTSRSGSQGTSSQGIAFEDLFANLFGGASAAAGGIDPSVLTGQANQLFGSGAGFLESLGGGGAETAYLQDRMSGESPVLQENIDLLGEDLGKFLNEQVMPGITSTSVSGGALGGSRQGVAQAGAIESVASEFRRGAAQLRTDDMAARDRAASTLGQQRIASAQTGLGGLSSLMGIAESGTAAQLAPFSMLSQIMGGPTVLTDSQSTSFGSAEDFAAAFSSSFGQNWSSSKSKSKSGSFGIKF